MATGTIQQFVQLPRAFNVQTKQDYIVLYGAAAFANSRRRSFFIFANDQSGQAFYIHLFTGSSGDNLSASWMFNSHTETLTTRIDGNNIVIDCSGTLLQNAWGNGIAITH